MQYSFIGLGNLGFHLAKNLANANIPVRAYDQQPEIRHRLHSEGVNTANSLIETVEGTTGLITCLPHPDITLTVLNEALPHLAAGSVWIEMSTVDFAALQPLINKARAQGVSVLAAPVTGGVHKAEAGAITVLVGGDETVYQQHEATLAAMGEAIFYVGTIEQAGILKVVTNMLAFIHLIGAGEALMLCKRAGIDLNMAFHAIKASSGNSFVHETESQVILNGSYDIGFTMDLAKKDAEFALEFGKRFGVPLPLASKMEEIFNEARTAYGGEAFSPMVVKLLEDYTGETLRAEGFPAQLGPDD